MIGCGVIGRRRLLAGAAGLTVAAGAGRAFGAAAGESWPGARWEPADPLVLGWSRPALEQLDGRVRALGVTSLTVVQDGRLVASWGPQDRKVNVRSVRKSLLGLLYGIAVAEGRIDLDLTLDALGIDDREPRLTAAEKRATIRHLLKARSGVYHPAAYENDAMKAKRPPRSSAGPDERWYYNNWDFNALGTIYERLTGEDIFRGFESRIARPIGMQDYMAADGRRVFDPASDHPAYVMALTARDLARVGHLVLNRGNWNGRTVVPAAWIAESVTAWSATDAGSLGYGYLWWTLPPAGRFGPGASLALGSDGQAIGVVPRLRLAVVQLCSDATKRPRRVRGADTVDLLGLVVEAAG